jgi:hypothetical protein
MLLRPREQCPDWSSKGEEIGRYALTMVEAVTMARREDSGVCLEDKKSVGQRVFWSGSMEKAGRD